MVQNVVASSTAEILSKKLGTRVHIGSVDLGLLHRIIIDDLTLYDQQGDSLLTTTRAAVSFDLVPLVQGRITVTSAQLLGLKANFYRSTASNKPNYQFVLDSLASGDKKDNQPLNLKINSLIIRHGHIKYNQKDIAPTPFHLNLAHIDIYDLSTHIILNHLTDNQLSLNIKKLSFKEQSGLSVEKLRLKLEADRQHAILRQFKLALPQTELNSDSILVSYKTNKGHIEIPTIKFKGNISQSKVTPYDIKCFSPMLKHFIHPLFIESTFYGTSTGITVKRLSIRSTNGTIYLHANGSLKGWNQSPKWHTTIDNLHLSANGIQFIFDQLGTHFRIPKEVTRLGSINFRGNIGGYRQDVALKGTFRTDAGNADIRLGKHGLQFAGHIESRDIQFARITQNKQFGIIASNISVKGTMTSSLRPISLSIKGILSKFGYRGRTYHNIVVDGLYKNNDARGRISFDDPLLKANIEGSYQFTTRSYTLKATIPHLSPSAILGIHTSSASYMLRNIEVETQNKTPNSYLELRSPFAFLHINGHYDYSTLWQSITQLVRSKLPTIPGLPFITKRVHNQLTLTATISDAEWLQQLFQLPIAITAPLHISANIDDNKQCFNMAASLPDLAYNDIHLKHGDINVSTPNDTLKAVINMYLYDSNGHPTSYRLQANAANNKLLTLLGYDNLSRNLPIHGSIHAETNFFINERKHDAAHVTIHRSNFTVGDSIWEVQPGDIIYSSNRLLIDHFSIRHNSQHIAIHGMATPHAQDSIILELKDIDLNYILNLVHFHAVEFSGRATGIASISSVFHSPKASAQINVSDFTFENGEMGTLHAQVDYNQQHKNININAVADDGPDAQTLIKGYIAPANDDIRLAIQAQGTKIQFLENFCGSFMKQVDAHAYGQIQLIGPLSHPNLEGELEANGRLHMTALNTDYHFKNIRIIARPNDIELLQDTIRDRNENIGILNGHIYHQSLSKLSYDLHINAQHLLSYDTHDFGTNTFYGTVYATGQCHIKGKNGETVIDINATPEKGSQFVYNVTSPDAIGSQNYIHWHDITPKVPIPALQHTIIPILPEQQFHHEELLPTEKAPQDLSDIPSDLHINFLINANPNVTLKLLMDTETGDNITLNGDGVIKANFFNKGAFNMYGTYRVDHGLYTLTIQNIIKKQFQFQPGGTIVFGGDAYDAPLNLQAKYTVVGVPLSDLNIGHSFASNNIRVDCLMNITGTPKAPKIDFNMDLPTLNSEAKQMVTSIINSEEEMNQQVLYLLAVGRFYAQNSNNNHNDLETQGQSQTSLAMQSLLSGTISQQLNNVLSAVIKDNSWNLGANISTGDEGFNNAEYEGLINGRLLNNRLLINGQFGYRDNANTTTSFIGDFDIRYLLLPNGNLAVKVYNQTNDRYFTRNSLTTQGLGIIMKRDFVSIRDLLGLKKHSKKTSKKRKKK